MNNNKFDEKQILDRGKSFMIAFIFSLVTPALIYFLTETFNFKFEGYANYLFLIWIPLTVCFILLIVKNAYAGLDTSTAKCFMSIFGVAGIVVIASTLFKVILGKNVFIINRTVTECFGELFMGCCMVIVSITYFLKALIDKKKFKEE